MKNKKGDVPVILLVLGVLAICGLAILSFIISETNIFDKVSDEASQSELGIFEDIYSAAEKVYFYKNINYNGLSEQEIEALLDAPNLEVAIEDNVLMINGRSRNIQVEYTTPLH